MNINVYLPDELGAQAKEAELPLSRILRDAVTQELERIGAMKTATDGMEEITLDLVKEGVGYKGRFTGKHLAGGDRYDVYLADDERLIVHDTHENRYWEHDATDEDDVAEAVEGLADDAAAQVMSALGFSYTVDI